MLSSDKNKVLTQVGPGTPMGDYLRRYWQPIAGASELDANPIRAIRLLGEDLVLYKDLGGRYGLVDRHCPHRRADLSYGFVEETGIRCNYHGWLMDEAGRVIEQPYDDTVNPKSKAKERCTTGAYPVKECAGLLFAYMGPQPVPELPVWEPFTCAAAGTAMTAMHRDAVAAMRARRVRWSMACRPVESARACSIAGDVANRLPARGQFP